MLGNGSVSNENRITTITNNKFVIFKVSNDVIFVPNEKLSQ